jgi:hypothetical protein
MDTVFAEVNLMFAATFALSISSMKVRKILCLSNQKRLNISIELSDQISAIFVEKVTFFFKMVPVYSSSF